MTKHAALNCATAMWTGAYRYQLSVIKGIYIYDYWLTICIGCYREVFLSQCTTALVCQSVCSGVPRENLVHGVDVSQKLRKPIHNRWFYYLYLLKTQCTRRCNEQDRICRNDHVRSPERHLTQPNPGVRSLSVLFRLPRSFHSRLVFVLDRVFTGLIIVKTLRAQWGRGISGKPPTLRILLLSRIKPGPPPSILVVRYLAHISSILEGEN